MNAKRRRLWILAAAVLLALVGGLAAGWFGHKATVEFGNDFAPVATGRVLRYERIAKRIWGPVCGGEDVAFSFAPLQKGQAGQASWQPDGKFRKCAIVITSSQHFSDRILCLVIVHEVGHLAGRKHSTNPSDPMYPRASERNIPALCR